MFNCYLVVRGADTVGTTQAVCIMALLCHLHQTIDFECAFNLFIMKTVITIEIK
jgi:hypothetical protein